MKKKYLITLGIVFFLAVFVSAQILSNNRVVDNELTRDEIDTLTTKGITRPNMTQLECDDTECHFKMFQVLSDGSIYNLGQHSFNREDLTRAEIGQRQINVSTAFLKELTGVIEEREDVTTREVVYNETEVNIKETR